MTVVLFPTISTLVIGGIFLSIFWGLAADIEDAIYDLALRSYLVVPSSRWRSLVFRLFVTHPVLVEATVDILYSAGVAVAGTVGYLLDGLVGGLLGLFFGLFNLYCLCGYHNGLRLRDRLENRRTMLGPMDADPQSQVLADLTVLRAEMRHSRNPVYFFKHFIKFLLGPAGQSQGVVERILHMFAERQVEIGATQDSPNTEGIADLLASTAQQELKERLPPSMKH